MMEKSNKIIQIREIDTDKSDQTVFFNLDTLSHINFIYRHESNYNYHTGEYDNVEIFDPPLVRLVGRDNFSTTIKYDEFKKYVEPCI